MSKKSEMWAKGWGISQDIGDLERKKREWWREWNELQLEREELKRKLRWQMFWNRFLFFSSVLILLGLWAKFNI